MAGGAACVSPVSASPCSPMQSHAVRGFGWPSEFAHPSWSPVLEGQVAAVGAEEGQVLAKVAV